MGDREKGERVYDLEERTSSFGESVIDLVRDLSRTPTNVVLVNQLVRSAASVGANYMEATGAESRKDFLHKISLCKKEAKESRHWLRMLLRANLTKSDECLSLQKEAHELTLIFSAIARKTKENAGK